MSDNKLRRRPIHDESKTEDSRSPKSPRRGMRAVDGVDSPSRRRKQASKNTLYPNLEEEKGSEEDSAEDSLDSSNTSDSRSPRLSKRDGYKKREATPRGRVDEPTSDNIQKQGTGSRMYFILIIGSLCIFTGILWHIYCTSQKQVPDHDNKPNYYNIFNEKLSVMKKKFPSQSERFWKLVNAPLRRLLTEEESGYPAVLLFGVPEDGGKTSLCFSKSLVKNINLAFNVNTNFHIDVEDLTTSFPARTKLELDRNLQRVLASSKGVVLDHVEKLPAEGALLLHGYCDGENAPYKSSVIIFMFHTNRKFESLNDKTFEDHLTDLWVNELGEDEMPALRSRMANNVAIIKAETELNC